MAAAAMASATKYPSAAPIHSHAPTLVNVPRRSDSTDVVTEPNVEQRENQLMASLPTTAVGKIDKKAIVAQLSG
jgi:non-ribosomal peptide synthetase component E (peptide arylation enzyme)